MRHSKSHLFLMELIIAILFFALSSTVCIQLFIKSYTLNKNTVNQNQAVIHAQNLAESYLACNGSVVEIANVLSSFHPELAQNTIAIYFDSDWQVCDKANALYTAQLLTHNASEDGLISANIQIFDKNNSTIYELNISHHIPERRGNNEPLSTE